MSMRYLVFSDLHGSRLGLNRLMAATLTEEPDVLICLGDILFGAYDGAMSECIDYLSSSSIPVIAVKGNCDRSSDGALIHAALPEEQILFFKGHRMLLRHVPFYHHFQSGDIAMCGHTHCKNLYLDGGVIYLNPGSIGKPRDGEAGYAVIDDSGIYLKSAETFATLEYLPI